MYGEPVRDYDLLKSQFDSSAFRARVGHFFDEYINPFTMSWSQVGLYISINPFIIYDPYF